MKKIVVLLGIAAAAFGAVKLLRGKEDEIVEPYQQPFENAA